MQIIGPWCFARMELFLKKIKSPPKIKIENENKFISKPPEWIQPNKLIKRFASFFRRKLAFQESRLASHEKLNKSKTICNVQPFQIYTSPHVQCLGFKKNNPELECY